MSHRLLVALSIVAVLSSFSHGYILVDDLTQGIFEKTYTDAFVNDTHERLNLDKSHVAFGERLTTFSIGGNLNHHPVTLRIGDGEAKVTTDTHDVSTFIDMRWGNSDLTTVDFSAETEIWIDLYTKDPANRFADIWNIYVRDSHGVGGNNPGWLNRQGGIRFRKQDFNPNLDWSSIEFMALDQRYTTDAGIHPFAYSVTKIYVVPEPAGLAVLAAAGVIAHRRKRRQQTSQRPVPPSL